MEDHNDPLAGRPLLVGITGGKGQLGVELTLRHVQLGHQVVHLDSDIRDRGSLYFEVEAALSRHKRERFDIIYNCAALVGTITCDIAGAQAWAVNVRGAEHVAEVALEHSESFVHLSTTAIYDPQVGKHGGTYDEGSAVRPHTLYGLTKAESEIAVARVWGESGRPLTIIRPCFCYGGGGDRVSTVRGYLEAAIARRPYIVQLAGENFKDWMYIADFGALASRWATDRRHRINSVSPRRHAGLPFRAGVPEFMDLDVVNIGAGHPTRFNDVRYLMDSALRGYNLTPPYVVDLPDDDYLGHHLISVERLRASYPTITPQKRVEEWIPEYLASILVKGT